jgi:hypothetical protein
LLGAAIPSIEVANDGALICNLQRGKGKSSLM